MKSAHYVGSFPGNYVAEPTPGPNSVYKISFVYVYECNVGEP